MRSERILMVRCSLRLLFVIECLWHFISEYADLPRTVLYLGQRSECGWSCTLFGERYHVVLEHMSASGVLPSSFGCDGAPVRCSIFRSSSEHCLVELMSWRTMSVAASVMRQHGQRCPAVGKHFFLSALGLACRLG